MAETLALVPVFSGTISNTTVQLCDARTLHTFMQVRRDFSNWIKGRIRKFGFAAGEDFITISRSPELASGNRGASIDYHLALDMAKELAMVENNEQGRAARRYFIEYERQALAAATTIDPGRIKQAYALAAEVAAVAARTVFDAVMDSRAASMTSRWMFCMDHPSRDGVAAPWAKPIEHNAMVVSMADLPRRLLEPGGMLPSNKELADLAAACNQRLSQRMQYEASKQAALPV